MGTQPMTVAQPIIATPPIIAAHRGLDEFAPENTAPAFISAFELGMAVEVDLRRTSDGEIVIIHDDTLDRTTSGAGPVAEATLAEIKTLDAGAWHDEQYAGERAPTLDDLLELAARHGRAEISLVLEMKVDDDDMGADVCGALNEHRLMQRIVALKVVRSELTAKPTAISRFRHEVRSAARLSHPNIVTAFDAERIGEVHFLVMEFVEGLSLDRFVLENGALPVPQACEFTRQAAMGLDAAHQHEMVHRDIKPQNLMVV